MIGFRAGGLWMLGLVCLAVGAGCADTADRNANPKCTGPVILTEEIDPVENPLSDEPGAVEIPLDQISAFPGMPETLWIGGDVHENSLDEFRRDWQPMILDIYRILPQWAPKEGNESPGFAVAGTNLALEAVRQVHAVLVEKQPPRQSFQAGSEITLVFFSYRIEPSVYLHRVDSVGNRIEIRYRFASSRYGRMRPLLGGYFALIPLGKLEAGEYHINVVKSALVREFINPNIVAKDHFSEDIIHDLSSRVYKPISRKKASRMVCNPFSFTVEEE